MQLAPPTQITYLNLRALIPTCSLSKDSLPYIDAIIQEVLRWNVIAPVAIPHISIQDDEYKGDLNPWSDRNLSDLSTTLLGYHIPKGSIIIANSWAISQDPEQYSDPEEFSPERFLPDDGQSKPRDPRLYAFGIGRR